MIRNMNSNTITFRLTRDVTQNECHWLHRDFKKDEEVFEYNGPTYGCISYLGVAVTEKPNETPFLEMPADSLKILD